ncbi:hypothetical protein CDAR_574221 [Caerostris darwini]|uniref:Uncharacterized protein n=1 Tax=Caerostris darwini TaxID=1538125 RepID=A0AAV4R9P6_9ARAC|nr:hypothetical protein CDAR_574221 [Caerostris darwini]
MFETPFFDLRIAINYHTVMNGDAFEDDHRYLVIANLARKGEATNIEPSGSDCRDVTPTGCLGTCRGTRALENRLGRAPLLKPIKALPVLSQSPDVIRVLLIYKSEHV